jgi:hypothetical protein
MSEATMQALFDRDERVAWQACRPVAIVVIFTAFFVVATGHLASRKVLWSDELLTLSTAELPSLADIWRELQDSVDAMPPLTHFLTHLCGQCFGFSHLTVRLPAIVGYWLLCVSVFAFLRRRVPLALATAGMLIPMTIPAAYSYAYEARGYGLLLGFAAAAVLCWDLAGSPRRRGWVIAALALCLVGTIGSHMYGVFVLGPLALAELVRTKERGRYDFGVWLGFACAGFAVLPLAPFLGNMRSIGSMMSGTGMSLRAALTATQVFLSTPATYLGLIAIVCLARPGHGQPDFKSDDRQALPRTSDWVLALGLASLSVWGYLVAALTTGVFTSRYVLPAVAGLSILVPLLLHRHLRCHPRALVLAACWLGLAACLNVIEAKHNLVEVSNVLQGKGTDYLLKLEDDLPQDGLPIVITQPHDFSRLRYYAREPLRQRLRLFADSNDWIRLQNDRHAKRDAHVVSVADFVRDNKVFYLYVPNAESEPILPRLIHEGAVLGDVGLNDTGNVYPRPGFLLKVTFPG